ncbi:MAG: phytanoyl-CoA dioxygenase family protein [Verrucomicrobia bacterium]|nr:phytanoyl-CoA dioxygenase family protein [Verrucomicrobiota bacterium]
MNILLSLTSFPIVICLLFTQVEAFDLKPILADLEKDGVTIIPELFSPEEMDAIHDYYEPIKEKILHVLDTDKGHQRIFQTDGVTTYSHYWKIDQDFILQAGPGRFDTSYGFREGSFASDHLLHHPILEQIMQQTLHKEYTNYAGIINAMPESGSQYWHRDTHNLADSNNDGSQLLTMDDFYFTVLIPLVPLSEENGTTEFRIGTHRKTAQAFDEAENKRFNVALGSAIVFNGKISHRGRENFSSHDRPVIYIVYHKKWYNDRYREGL